LARGALSAELGVAPAWTVGITAYRADAADDRSGRVFARRHLQSGAGGDEVSADLGLGLDFDLDLDPNPNRTGDLQVRPGLS
jgi:hypothetical protein